MSRHLPSPTTGRGRARHLLALFLVSSWLVTIAPGAAAQSQPPPDEASASVEAAAVPIPISSLGDLTSLEASVTLNAVGALQGKEMAGDLTVQLVTSRETCSARSRHRWVAGWWGCSDPSA